MGMAQYLEPERKERVVKRVNDEVSTALAACIKQYFDEGHSIEDVSEMLFNAAFVTRKTP